MCPDQHVCHPCHPLQVPPRNGPSRVGNYTPWQVWQGIRPFRQDDDPVPREEAQE